MKESKIFIDTFREQNITLGLKSESENEKRLSMITGIHLENSNPENEKKRIVSEIFNALLFHDRIIIKTIDIRSIINAFGLKDTLELLKMNRFEFFDDQGNSPAIEIGEKFNLTYLSFAHESGKIKNTLEYIESKFKKLNQDERTIFNLILLNAEKKNLLVNTEILNKKIEKEINFDFNNLNNKSSNFNTSDINNIKKEDIYKVLRICKLNKSLIYSSELNVDNISIDWAVKDILSNKISPIFSEKINTDLYDDFFKEIFSKKNIPDLSTLYLRKIITINDYINLISTLGGKRFRHWISQKDYDYRELEKDILNSNPKISNKFIDLIRWGIPNTIGLFLPSVGITTSFVDSFVIDKLIKGWHPNLFLDDILKKNTNKFINEHERKERINLIKNKFPTINRNDLCPCESGKKFKKCCGE